MKAGRFYWGLLVGLVLGVAATSLSESLFRESQPQASRVAIPSGYVVFPQTRPLPSGWQRRQFNGRAYYFVPLGIASP